MKKPVLSAGESDETDSLVRAVAAAPPLAPLSLSTAHTAPKPEPRSEDVADDGGFELARGGLRFSRRETEAAYRVAWEREKLRPIRAALLMIIVTIFLAALLSPWWADPAAQRGFRLLQVGTAVFLCLPLGVMFWKPRRLWLRETIFAIVLVSNPLYLVVLHEVAPEAIGGVWLTAILEVVGVCLLLQLGFLRNAIFAIVVLGTTHLVVRGSVLDRNAREKVATLYVTANVCLAASYISERRDRRLFRNEQLLARERARSETLLQRELQHQVAERSRGLSEALARLSQAPNRPSQFQAGEVVDERYRIVRVLGAGGMGQVHEVERLSDGQRLALKTLRGVADREVLARFAREAQVAAGLQHPNVVAALDVGVTRSGTLFVVMELIAGPTLAAERARYGDMPWALPVLAQVARALSVMHERGIVHRDIKPSNVLLDGMTAKVTDFGIAGLLDQVGLAEFDERAAPPASPTLTRTGAIMGTPLYMAPELASGARDVGPAADLFSFGVVAYELLSKKLPFAAPPVTELLAGHAWSTPPPLADSGRGLPASLCDLVDRCLAEAPEARPTAAAVAAAFEQLR
jgi:hypothetical protein